MLPRAAVTSSTLRTAPPPRESCWRFRGPDRPLMVASRCTPPMCTCQRCAHRFWTSRASPTRSSWQTTPREAGCSHQTTRRFSDTPTTSCDGPWYIGRGALPVRRSARSTMPAPTNSASTRSSRSLALTWSGVARWLAAPWPRWRDLILRCCCWTRTSRTRTARRSSQSTTAHSRRCGQKHTLPSSTSATESSLWCSSQFTQRGLSRRGRRECRVDYTSHSGCHPHPPPVAPRRSPAAACRAHGRTRQGTAGTPALPLRPLTSLLTHRSFLPTAPPHRKRHHRPHRSLPAAHPPSHPSAGHHRCRRTE
mmetsp:Transcript_9312/g.23932  ORF Transcript_9312/g.23932 Transcript_9312/m.23932 type:complete len:308 (-) Transcript_9312:1298-2221(-)